MMLQSYLTQHSKIQKVTERMDFCYQVHTHKKGVPRTLKTRPIARLVIIHGIVCSVFSKERPLPPRWGFEN